MPEIVRTEGFNEFDTADISAVSGTTLAAYDLVILGDMSLTAAQASMFISWVNGGGNLIAMHPDPQLAGLLGLVDTGTALSNAYVLMSTSAGPGVGLVGQTIQFHGPAELYTLNGATSYATLYSNATTPTSNPAVTLNLAGSGQAAAFTYDLARSVAYTRQGNPAWTGEARDASNTPPIRAYNLFYGPASFDEEPNWIDFTKVEIPQADEQQRLLANLILLMTNSKMPLPRFWYLPKGLKAAVVMTGDDHGSFYSGSATANRFNDFLNDSPAGCSVANWECIRSTAYLFPNIIATTTLTNAQVASYLAQGFEIGVHVDSATDCQDWTTSALNTDYSNYLTSFASEFPSLPAPQTHRMHCVSWSDYDSQPTVELQHGIRFDTTYYYWPSTWINDLPGMFTGSGMPMRYTDRNGNLINVYQATTQMTDESGQTYPYTIDTLLDNALNGSGYFGVFTANMHNDGADYPGPGADFIVAAAQASGVPVVTSLQMLQWLDGRNGSSFGSLAWSSDVLSFTVTVGANANNLTAMLPVNFGTLGLSSLTLSGSPVTYQLQTIKGVQYAMFSASAGTYQATYGGAPLFSITGTISPADVAAGTTITATGPVTLTASPDSYGNYSLNGLPSGTYIVTPTQGSYGFSPASQLVTISGTNVAAVNFNVIQTCPCSLWTNATVPANPSVDDPNAVELGVRFHSDLAGTITGIRFYKSSSNTGTHIGNLWTNTGTLLATATFTNETASGWQQVSFSSPVSIAANTYYVASYHTTTGFYAGDGGYFANSYDNPPLHAVQDGTSAGSNGVYLYGASAFPTNTYLSTNYYVDVVLTTSATATLSSVALSPTSVTGGTSSTGTVTLSSAAPTGGAVVTLSSNNAAATPPASVTVAAGATTATFTVTTTAVATTASATITGSYSGGTQTATLTVNPPVVSSVTLNPTSVTGGTSSTGTVTLSGTAPTGGASVSLSSNNAAATLPASVTVAAGTTTATFTVTTTAVASAASATISATFNGGTQTGTLTVNPPAAGSVTLNPTSVTGGTSSTGTVTLSSAAPTGGLTVTLSSNNAAATVPASITVAAGATTATFTVTTTAVASTATATISATFNSGTQTAALTVNPPVVSSVTLNPTSVTGGTSSTGTVTLSSAAPTGGLTVTLSSNNAAASVPTSVTVAAGATTATFTVATTAVASAASATISATFNGGTQTATLAVNPPVISSVTLNPASVTGGTSSTGTVTLSGTAPTGGASVSLSSNNAAATLPASVTVAAGATTATFTVTTTAVASTTSATISATYGATQTATLTVDPSGSTFSISGTISGSGGNGATVTLSGTASATVTASSTGTYTFSNLANGSYTVTPSKTGYIFTPADQSVTVSGANTTANFTSTAQLAIDKTASTDRSTKGTTIASPAFTTSSANELLLAFVSTDATTSGMTVTGVTGGSLTWTLVKRTNTQLGTAEIWRAFATTTLSSATVTATLSQSVAASITVVTFTGVDTTGTGGSGAIGATGSGNANPGAPTASLTTTRNNSWVFGVGNDWDNAISRTLGANQTMVHQYLATVEDTYWVQRQTATTPTSGTVVTINDTAPTTDRYNLSICEVLPSL